MKTAVNKSIIPRSRKQKTMKEFLLMILGCVIYPFYKLIVGIIWLWNAIVYEDIETGNNGILGPGFQTFYTTRVAWGKISFFLLIIFFIVVGIVYICH